jgi:P27 family predicted phage terminase small subunit
MQMDILRSDKPPAHLTAEARRIWKQLVTEYDFETDGLLVLRVALESFDRLQTARRTLDKEGLTVKMPTQTGQRILKHPALEVEKHARTGFLQAMRMLGIHNADDGI